MRREGKVVGEGEAFSIEVRSCQERHKRKVHNRYHALVTSYLSYNCI